MLNKIFFFFFILLNSISWAQEINVYHLISENKKNPNGPLGTASLIYLNEKITLTSYSIFHYTPSSISDTIIKVKKKLVAYKNSKTNCDFNLNSKFEKLIENHEMKVAIGLKKHLIISTANLGKIIDQDRFIIHELESDSELEIQRELNKIITTADKGSINDVYIFTDKYQVNKPSFSFANDSVIGNGEIEIKFTTTSIPKKINWSSNVKFKENDPLRPVLLLNSTQVVLASYIDENGCSSNEDQLKFIYKAACNCEASMGKPEIQYHKSKNILDKTEEDEVEWDYKAIPEQSGSLVYEIPVRKVCAERFIVEIKSNTGKQILREYYEMESVDERSENPLAKESKNILVFTLPLDEFRSIIETADSYFIVSITPEIDGEECQKRKFTSSKIRFSKCR